MKAVVITSFGGPEVLQLQEVEDHKIGADELLIKIEATALSRADTIQRIGLHPPPKGASPYLGLECSGIVEAIGKNITRWKIGDQVCALLSGGGYAEKVAVPAGQVLPVPPGCEEKLAFCKDIGVDVCINYKTEDFVARVKEKTGGKGVDVILDNVAGPYFQRNLDSLNVDGRLFIVGFMGGEVSKVNLVGLLARCLTVQAAGLRNRSPENKALIVSEVEKNVWPAITAGKVEPVVYKSIPLDEAAVAHRLMESGKHIGKILLVP